ncbi:Putative helicase, P-loop containing nucleoside triphosphate hydrolase, SNF2-like domain superfamily [Septoria linicola]|uniref:Helicase, P-loop containing nucleoside triphosphate hydrolase, SNF2-like domain superfamily n=1 Tax=Septoria linicola TaxID=215465 RepID=A0A9Q9EGS9_9PEZI|nr:putative helicase, P-loop containing nucleoside triphosphate hydrolase, SNF2-like domain superfamily [Septoria linicola]USW50310.1 Putative helicase, P-loop containing nucleoside triphosphate hydrolase, SNF2-like domain superfamily [Septoria linicola]
MSSEAAVSAKSTPPTSPDNNDGPTEAMQKEEARMAEFRRKEDEKREKKLSAEREKERKGGDEAVDTKYKALEYLLSQSKLYSTIMLQQMSQQEEAAEAKDEKSKKRALKREETAEKAAQEQQTRATRASATTEKAAETATKELPRRGRQTKKAKGGDKILDYMKKEDIEAKAGKTSISEALAEETKDADIKPGDIGMQDLRSAKQPDLVTGGLMRTYQLEGLDWLTSLYENGLNGILADEMGLGKTIQTISFIAFLREKGVNGPFLIAAPLSTTSNWVAEFKKWTPSIPVVLYHGSKQEREEIRRKQLRNPSSENFPVVCTSYEICMNDRKHLAHFGWKFIIIDEGHRLKNLNCRLIRELQSYQSANRLLITGTPLQNNLTELWSLLHFLMPSIFDKLESFESWFDFSALKEKGGYEEILSKDRQKNLVTSLHAILKPFLLRRVKADVETSLPKKREYVLYAPLTQTQRELYHEILEGNSRAYLENKVVESLSGVSTPASARSRSLKRKAGNDTTTPNKSAKSSRASTPATTGSVGPRSRKAKKTQQYEEVSDTQYFKQLEEEESQSAEESTDSLDEEEAERAKTLALAKRELANKKLQNPIMQLRQCCNSPHNFFYPFDLDDNTPVDETLVTESGKMLLLDRLLPELLSRGHKVLIFSQFKTQLDLLETYCTDLRGWSTSRIDGSVAQTDRQQQILDFNDTKSDTNIFLLSTRAGGQGINLAAADTVLLFDSDWNPQQDLQAQDRAHRIGQTRPVIVYRFATKGTVEQMLLEKADSKRRLEKLVIQKGRFRNLAGGGGSSGGGADFSELQKLLSKDDGERIDVADGKGLLSDKDLAILTDRSPEAFERAEKGIDVVGEAFKAVETRKDGEGLLESLQK